MDVKVYLTTSEEETFELGIEFSSRLVPGDVVAFYGELGAGKTEFIKGICQGLEVHEIVSSPTYTIVNHYEGEDRAGREVGIDHIDLYRVEAAEELVEIGMNDILSDTDSIKLIEWAENAVTVLPPLRFEVHLYNLEDENSRRIEILHRDVAAVMAR